MGIDVPFGTSHDYMGTHNHKLLLGNSVYLEIVALDPKGADPGRARWFGLDDQVQIRAEWDEGRRLRGWVANTVDMLSIQRGYSAIFGDEVALPTVDPTFSFTIPDDGSLPLDGAAPSLIDHCGDASHIATIPDLGAQLSAWTLEHPDPGGITALLDKLAIDRPPVVVHGARLRYRALIKTPGGLRELT